MAVSTPLHRRPRARERAVREEVREELRRVDGHRGAGRARAGRGGAGAARYRRPRRRRSTGARPSAGEPPLADAEGLARRILDDILGLGPLQPLLDDPAVEEIIVNGPHRVFAIEGGRKRLTDVFFEDDDELLRLVRRADRSARPAAGRDQPDGGRAPAGRLAPERRHPAAHLALDARHDPQVPAARPHPRRPGGPGHPDRRGGGLPGGGACRPASTC